MQIYVDDVMMSRFRLKLCSLITFIREIPEGLPRTILNVSLSHTELRIKDNTSKAGIVLVRGARGGHPHIHYMGHNSQFIAYADRVMSLQHYYHEPRIY